MDRGDTENVAVDIPREAVERLKAKYRKEALKAVASAQADGQRRVDELQEQNSKLRAIIEATQSSRDGTSNPVLLVQYIIEKIYRKIKQELATPGTECSFSRIKDILLSSADSLLENLPEIILRPDATHSAEDQKNNSKSVTVSMNDELPVGSVAAQQAHHARTSWMRPLVCRVLHQPQAPKYFVRVKILDTAENVVKGMFVDSEYTSYRVECELYRINYQQIDANRAGHRTNAAGRQGHLMLSYTLDKRNRDFKALHALLTKEFSRLIIPDLPSRPYKARSAKDNTSEQRVRFRQRQYSVWLQYMANIERMQVASQFVQFLTGMQKLGGADLSTSKRDLPGRSAVPAFRASSADGESKRNRGIMPSSANSSSAAPSLQLPELRQGTLTHRLQDVSECFIFARGSQSLTHASTASAFYQEPLLYRPAYDEEVEQQSQSQSLLWGGSAGDTALSSLALTILTRRQQAYRDLHTVKSDIAQLEPVAVAATEKAHMLSSSYSVMCQALGEFTSSLNAWGRTESMGTMEHAALLALTDASGAVQTPTDQMAESIQQECYEHLEFLFGNCVRAARDTVDRVHRSHPDWSFLSDVTLPEEGSSSGSGGSGSSIALKGASEAICSAVTLAQSWESSRRVRSSMLLHQLLTTARIMTQQYATISKLWEHAAKTVRSLKRASDGVAWADAGGCYNSRNSGVDRDRDRGGSSRPGVGQGLTPGLEAENASLKTAIFDELQEYEDSINAMKETQERAAQMQEEFVKISSSMTTLRSFGGLKIFSRAKLPKGVRRDPSSVKRAAAALTAEDSAEVGAAPVADPVGDLMKGSGACATSSSRSDAREEQQRRRRARGHPEDLQGSRPRHPAGKPAKTQHSQQEWNASSDPKDTGLDGDLAWEGRGRGGGEERAQTHPYGYSAQDAMRGPAHTPQEQARSSNTSDFQDQRQRHNVKRQSAAQGASGSSGSRGGTGRLHAQSKGASQQSLPQNVFGAAPQPAASVCTVGASAVEGFAGNDTPGGRAGGSLHEAGAIPIVPPTSARPRSHSERSEAEGMGGAGTSAAQGANGAKRGFQRKDASKTRFSESDSPAAANRSSGRANTESSSSGAGASGAGEKGGDSEGVLPSGWQPVVTEDGSVYYYHTVTRVSRWDRPTEEVAAALEARLQKSQAEVGEAVKRRKEEREQEKKLQEQREAVARKLQSKVNAVVGRWRQPPNCSSPRDLGQLLSSVPSLLDFVPADAIVSSSSTQPLSIKSTPSELRKAYLKAVRFVHPDKLPDDLSMEQQLVAEAVFIALTDEFNSYLSKQDVGKS